MKTRGAEGGESGADAGGSWSAGQQKALENALKSFPKGTDRRWDRIANAVPDKTKVRNLRP